MSLTVKAFLEKDGKEAGEIRRFQIPADVSSSYAYLTKKLSDIFPSLTGGTFSVYWKDPDGDMILFSTDDELLEALGFVTDSLLRVFVKRNDPSASNAKPDDSGNNISNELWEGIVCDGCDSGIRGIRFKCVMCPDYDLCSVCEKKGLHSEHNMMKMTKPNQPPQPPMFFAGPPPTPPYGHFPPRHHGHPRPGEPFAPPPHFRRWMRKFMKRWHNKNAAGCPMDDKDDSTEDQEGETTGEEEYLKNVGQSIATMLDPFGIDVHVDVEHGGKRHCSRGRGVGRGRGCGRNRGGCMRGQSWGPEGAARSASPKRKAANKQKKDENKAEEKVEMEAEKEAPVVDEPKKDDADDIVAGTEKIVISDDVMATTDLVKEADAQPRTEAPKMDVQRGADKDTPDSSDNTWTLLNVGPPSPRALPLSGAQAQAAAPQAPVSQVQPRPQAPVVQFQMPPQVVYPPSNPRVAEALQQMMAMGFNNEGGWLTRLLEAKQGDIIQVLDAIKPQPGRTNQNANGDFMA